MRRTLVAGVAVLMVLLVAAGRQPAGAADWQAGNAAFQNEAWQEAADRYLAAEAAGVRHALLHFRLGFSLHMLRRYEEALPHHLRAAHIHSGPLRIDALYNSACAHALLGRHEEALKYLQYAVDAGFRDVNHLDTDGDMDSLREDPAFKAIAAQIGKLRLAERMDFFLGTWESHDAEGKLAQTFTLERPLAKSSAIVTTATSSGGGEWTGLLVPDAKERTWAWTRADGIGTTLALTGTPVEPAGVRFHGHYHSVAGQGSEVRLTYTPRQDGTVAEAAEVSEDGKTWRTHHEEVFTKAAPGGS